MRPRVLTGSRLSFIVHAALLLAGVSTYLISPDDVVWHFIKTAPHPRVLEHAFFGLAAVILGTSLFLKMKPTTPLGNPGIQNHSRSTATVASLLQAIGIGSLLPLPGFLVLTLGDLAGSLLLDAREPIAKNPENDRDRGRARSSLHSSGWRSTLARHIGLCLSVLSMAVFSAVLIDRVADVLFAVTGVVSVAVNLPSFLSGHR